MSKKKQVEDSRIVDIRKALEGGKALLGTKRSLKALREGKVATIYLTSNTPQYVKEDIQHYAGITDIDVIALDISNKELGVVCKKPFLVSVLSVTQ
jgi:large subunit ribosomal protein L30e